MADTDNILETLWSRINEKIKPGENEELKSYVDGAVAGKADATHTHKLADVTDAPNSHTSGLMANTLVSRNSANCASFGTPNHFSHAATKGYVDDAVGSKANKSYVDSKDAEVKAYVDSKVPIPIKIVNTPSATTTGEQALFIVVEGS